MATDTWTGGIPEGSSLPVIEAGSLEAYLRHVESEDAAAAAAAAHSPFTAKADPLLTDTLQGQLSPPLMTREQLLATAFPSRAPLEDPSLHPKLPPAGPNPPSPSLTQGTGRVSPGSGCYFEPSELETETGPGSGPKFPSPPRPGPLASAWSGAY